MIIIEMDGTTREIEIEWSIESIRATMDGDFRIVASHDGKYVIEMEGWHSRGIGQNMVASELVGRALHGRILIAEGAK